MVPKLALEAELVVDEVIRQIARGLVELLRSTRSDRRHRLQRDDAAIDVGLRTVEAARTETLRPGVVREDVRGDVPGQVGAALEAALALVEGDAEAAVRAGAIGHVQHGRGRAVVLRAVLEFVVLVVTS